jgi:hypothetical protein
MKVLITQAVLDSLSNTVDFYLYELEIPSNFIASLIDQLFLKIDRLPENPFLGQIEPTLISYKKDHRRIVLGNIKIIYRVDQEVIYITDIFDSRQNPSKMEY